MKGAEWQLPSFFQARQDASHDSQGKNKQTDARSRSGLHECYAYPRDTIQQPALPAMKSQLS